MRGFMSPIRMWLFGSDIDYRLDYILMNIDKLTMKDLMSMTTLRCYYRKNNKDDEISIDLITENLKYIKRVIDEETDVTLGYDRMLFHIDEEIELYRLVESNNRIPFDFNIKIANLLKIYRETKLLCENIDSGDLVKTHNYNIFCSHIITVEDIINKVFNIISKR